MLKELYISNYRLFDELTIPDLGQVNLIAGKNNTGKTALLEALRIWAARGNSSVVNHLLKVRGQFTPDFSGAYLALFTNNTQLNSIKINEIKLEKIQDRDGFVKDFIITIPTDLGRDISQLQASVTADYPQDKSIFVPFNIPHFPLQLLWENIVLTPLEGDVLDILKIIEPRLHRIDVNEENSKVLLQGDSKPVSLKSLGEGMSRMLWLAVALVSAKESKLLLIDEFEAGLHHSVQESLWKKVFQYAKEWKIQVFVTTHSMDTVRTFHDVAELPGNAGVGKFFRLQRNRDGQIEVVGYGEEELATALEFDLETR